MSYRHVLHGLGLYCTKADASPSDVEIVFATQKKIGIAARNGARKQFTREGFPEPGFRDMRQYPALQAADMLAWLTYQEIIKGYGIIQQRHAPLIIKPSASYIDEAMIHRLGARLRALHDGIERERIGDAEPPA